MQDMWCSGCGYDLSGVPTEEARGRCPECGRGFVSYDPMTFSPTPEVSRVRRVLGDLALKTPGKLTFVPLGVLCVVAAYGMSLPGWNILAWATLFFGGVPIASTLLVRLLAAVMYLGVGGGFARSMVNRRRLWYVSGLIALGVILVFTQATMYVRFWISRPYLEAYAANVRDGAINPQLDPGWIGLYNIRTVIDTPDGVYFDVKGTGFLGSFGYLYVPDGNNTPDVYSGSGVSLQSRLSNTWWIAWRDF